MHTRICPVSFSPTVSQVVFYQWMSLSHRALPNARNIITSIVAHDA